MNRSLIAICGALSAIALLPAAATAKKTDFAGQAFQVLAPGANGAVSASGFNVNSSDQGIKYDNLTPLGGNVSAADVKANFVSEKFGIPKGGLKVETGRKGLKIVRSADGIPHIYGTTRCSVAFGMGYMAAKDRGALLSLGLGPAFAATLDIPGVNAFGLVTSARKFTPSPAARKFVADQALTLKKYGKEGKEILADFKCWADGVNALNMRERAPEVRMPTVGLTEAIAAYSFIGSIFGNGGGGGVDSSIFLNKLQDEYGATVGTRIYRELHQVNEPEATTSIPTSFPYNLVPTGATPGSPKVDPGSKNNLASRTLATTMANHRRASNALLASPGKSATGNGLAVMGPQLGYFNPEIVMQVDIHGPGIDAAGAAPPTMPYVLLGRGKDFAWSLTSAGNDNTDVFLEKLCEPGGGQPTRSSDHYLYKGQCKAMTTFDAGLLGAGGGQPARELTFKESVHGPVGGTVTVGGQPYAIATLRATRGREPVSALFFKHMNENKPTSPKSFFKVANELETTFNIHYAERKHIAYFSSGRLPVRAAGTDPSLATLGTGEYDWKGFLTQNQHPHQADPPSGYILNWNNKPAPMWGAADGTWGEGSVQRVEMFTGFPAKSKLENVVGVMNGAATRDIRGSINWPVIKRVLALGTAPTPLATEAANAIQAWSAAGSVRIDANLDGKVDAPGAAVMDKAWSKIARAVISGKLTTELTDELRNQMGYSNNPGSGGSSFGSGWYSYVDKDLRTLLGDTVKSPWTDRFCGNGNSATCASDLWAAIDEAAQELSNDQGGVVANWHADGNAERIKFGPLAPPELRPANTLPTGVGAKFTMRWTNRPTFQQAIEFNSHR
ncbi:MAG: hypothetical protein F2813_06400 [Actinobacteria bacterium]|uniref:Unannotated protein n=1 Tax=freshwater metagenome TaxID=449393 RepID=A0A6J5ZTY2_9ZZZZ|nr:hypothetical protein [Actinomycetota bacterium]